MGEAADEGKVLAPGQVLVDGRVLPGEADRRPHPLGVLPYVDAEHPGAPRVGAQQRRQHPHRGGLARAVGSEQPEHLALRDLQRDPLHRFERAEALHQAVGHDRRFCHGEHARRDPSHHPAKCVARTSRDYLRRWFGGDGSNWRCSRTRVAVAVDGPSASCVGAHVDTMAT